MNQHITFAKNVHLELLVKEISEGTKNKIMKESCLHVPTVNIRQSMGKFYMTTIKVSMKEIPTCVINVITQV